MNNWISVNENLLEPDLPEPDQHVLVYVNQGSLILTAAIAGKGGPGCVIDDGRWYDLIEEDAIAGDVTHWMPLPDKPEKVELKETLLCNVCECSQFHSINMNFSKNRMEAICIQCLTKIIWFKSKSCK